MGGRAIISTDDCNHTPLTLTNPFHGTCQKYDVRWVLVMTLLLQVGLPLLTLIKLRSEVCCQYQSRILRVWYSSKQDSVFLL
jgi:hypothetical protein